MPAARLRCSSSEKVFAVIATIGMVAASGRCIARIVRVASSPSISGIITSIRMQSNVPGSLSEKRRTASFPFHA